MTHPPSEDQQNSKITHPPQRKNSKNDTSKKNDSSNLFIGQEKMTQQKDQHEMTTQKRPSKND
jgi:hypothetical protein